MKSGKVRYAFFAFALVILLSSPFVFAGIGDWFGRLTGKAVTDTTSVTITIGNTPPVIHDIQTTSAVTLTLSDVTQVQFNVNVSDADGVGNLDDNYVRTNVTRTGETNRTDNLCSWYVDWNGTMAGYTCSINMDYYDSNGTWTKYISARDINGGTDIDNTDTFTVNILNAMNISLSAVTFPGSITTSSTDVGAANDPIDIYNLGNVPLAVNLSSFHLAGATTSTLYIYAENFSIDSASEGCSGTVLTNDTGGADIETVIPGVQVARGSGHPSDSSYLCLKGVPQDATAQDYNTDKYGLWTFETWY